MLELHKYSYQSAFSHLFTRDSVVCSPVSSRISVGEDQSGILNCQLPSKMKHPLSNEGGASWEQAIQVDLGGTAYMQAARMQIPRKISSAIYHLERNYSASVRAPWIVKETISRDEAGFVLVSLIISYDLGVFEIVVRPRYWM